MSASQSSADTQRRTRPWEVGLTQRLALGTAFAVAALACVAPIAALTWWCLVTANEWLLRPLLFTRIIQPAAAKDAPTARLFAAVAGVFATTLWAVLPSMIWLSGSPIGPPLAIMLIAAIFLHVVILFRRDRAIILSPYVAVLLVLPFVTYPIWPAFVLAFGVLAFLTSLTAGILDRDKLVGLVAAKEMSRKLAESDSAQKSRFVATMSHEIRTPLNAMIGYSEILIEDLEGAQHDDASRIHRAAHHLLHIVNQVLDISQLDAGQAELAIQPVVIDEIVASAVAAIGDASARRGNAVHSAYEHNGALAHADPRRLSQCLGILLQNACQFTENGLITVRTRGDAQRVQIDVIDTGVGIAPGDLPRLFRDFEQIDQSRTREHDGTGLGLALARRLARLMGGDIEVTSQLGQGSTFSINLPRHASI